MTINLLAKKAAEAFFGKKTPIVSPTPTYSLSLTKPSTTPEVLTTKTSTATIAPVSTKGMSFPAGQGLSSTTEVKPGPRIATQAAIKRGEEIKVTPTPGKTSEVTTAKGVIQKQIELAKTEQKKNLPTQYLEKAVNLVNKYGTSFVTGGTPAVVTKIAGERPKETMGLAATVAQAPPRLLAGLALSATGQEKEVTPQGAFQRLILGKEPIKSMGMEAKEAGQYGAALAEKINPELKGKTDIWSTIQTLPPVAASALIFGGLKALDADVGLGAAEKKVTKEVLEKAGKEVLEKAVKKEGKNILNKISETIFPLARFKTNQTKQIIPEAEKAPETAVQKIITALKEAKPIRKEQEALYTTERGKRIAKVEETMKQTSGQAGFYAQLSQMKGELPKAQFQSIKNKVTQTDIDELFNSIQTSDILTPFEKITAQTGLSKLIGASGGVVPTKGELSLLSEVFPPEFIDAALKNRSLVQKLWTGVEQVLNLPRAIMATADLSAPLRQGLFLVGRPKQFLPAFKDMFKYAFSEKAYEGLLTTIKKRPTYNLMRENKLALTDMSSNMLSREEAFMSNLAEKFPVFGKLARGSNRAYSGFLNKLRADVFDDLVKSATRLGITEKNPKVIEDIAKFINSATGRGSIGSLERITPILSAAFFSPRLMASRLNLLSPYYYYKLDPFVRKEALKSLFTFAGAVGTVLGLAKLSGAQVGTDPRSADFGKIKIGNTRFDVMGGFQQYLVLGFRLATGQSVSSTTGKEYNLGEGYKPTTRLDLLARFFENKSSPLASFAIDMLSGQTAGGEKVDVPVEIADRFIPMLVSDLYDLRQEYGNKGMLMGIPGIFGIGSQTYADKIPLESKTAMGKPTIKWATKPGLGAAIVNKIRGKEVSPVPVKAKYDEVQRLLKEGKTNEAKAIMDSLSTKDYALYKKFKEKDRAIAVDEAIKKVKPIYDQVQELIKQEKTNEAQKLVDALSDIEYAAYKKIKASDFLTIQ